MEKIFRKGEVIIREGDSGSTFYRILSGTAGVYLQYGEPGQIKLTDMQPGQYFGEMAVIESWPRSTTVVAEDELRAVELTEATLNDFFTAQPDQILALMKQLGGRLQALTQDYNEVSAYLREKQGGAVKDKSFLSRLRHFVEISALAKNSAYRATAEAQIKALDFKRTADSPLPITAYKTGDIIYREGDTAPFMYSVQSGSVGVYAKYGTPEEKKLTSLFPVSFFGEMGLLTDAPRSATVVVEENNTMLETIRAEDLQRLFEVNPAEVDMILRYLSNRLRMLTRDYVRACDQLAAES